jgi:GGDEF domain-containing protein
VLARRLSERVAAATVPAAAGVSLAVSVGVAAWKSDHDGLDTWLRAADASLYAGKALHVGCR